MRPLLVQMTSDKELAVRATGMKQM